MAKTTFASRIATLRQRAESEHKRSESNLAVWIGALYELLGVRRISRIQINWARRRVITIRDMYPDDLRVLKMLDDLDKRADEAWDRHLKRIAKREEARAVEDSSSTPALPATPSAPKPSTKAQLWKSLLDQKQPPTETNP